MIPVPLRRDIDLSLRQFSVAELAGMVFRTRRIPSVGHRLYRGHFHRGIQVSTVAVYMIDRSCLRDIYHRIFLFEVTDIPGHVIAGPCPAVIALPHGKPRKTHQLRERLHPVRYLQVDDISFLHHGRPGKRYAPCAAHNTGLFQILPSRIFQNLSSGVQARQGRTGQTVRQHAACTLLIDIPGKGHLIARLMQRCVHPALRPDHTHRKQNIDDSKQEEREHEGRLQRHGSPAAKDDQRYPL